MKRSNVYMHRIVLKNVNWHSVGAPKVMKASGTWQDLLKRGINKKEKQLALMHTII